MNCFSAEQVASLLAWYDQSKRDLPWRHTTDPYAIYLSEIMLQQTQVETVKGYYNRFLEVFPTVFDLAYAPTEIVLKLWEGLGYYSRARHMIDTAKKVVENHNGNFPSSFEGLLTLPGVGKYTAGAVASIAFGETIPAVDGNVLRVVARFSDIRDNISDQKTKDKIFDLLRGCIPIRAGDFNQSLIELGACVCTPKNPNCVACPIKNDCYAYCNKCQSELPNKAKLKNRTILNYTIVILNYKGKTVLFKRPNEGLLAGMYQPLLLEGDLTLQQVKTYLSDFSCDEGSIKTLPSSKHIFTHLEWHMTAYYADVNRLPDGLDQYVLATPFEAQNDYPVPSAFSAYKSYLYL